MLTSLRTKRIALALTSASLILLAWPDHAPARDRSLEGTGAIAVTGLSLWLKGRFSETELQGLLPGDLSIETHYCGCHDQPKAHFPYPVVLVKTPKGDLVARPDSREGAVSFTPLAVRHGELYCEVEAEQDCYGSFSEPCDFTDFRYGPHLEPFFPTCKSQGAEALLLPNDADSSAP